MEIVEIDELDALSRLRMRLAQVSKQASHSIYRVPKKLRDVNNKAYEPEMVAIGPYHHGKDNLRKMEEVKLRYMQSLLDRKPEVPIEHYLSAIARIGKKARDCYAEVISLNAAEFIEMLVLDGCFIIEIIGEFKIHNDRTFPGLERDLVLLENQIPLFALCELFDLIEGPDKHTLLMIRVLAFCRSVFPGNVLYNPNRKSEDVKHILDLIHGNWYPYHDHRNTSGAQTSWCDLVIPSAMQLKDANVKFKKKEYNRDPDRFHGSRGTTVFDVEFLKEDGVMLMPALVIEDSTESMLRNLIAFEQYLPSNEPARITDYASLLDGLITSWKDVQILSQQGIIETHLGSDQAVADFVNRLTAKIVHYKDNFIYADTFDRINRHHKKCWNRAVAVFHRDYFSSPWAYVSFIAALVLLLLTTAQTVFAALQQFK